MSFNQIALLFIYVFDIGCPRLCLSRRISLSLDDLIHFYSSQFIVSLLHCLPPTSSFNLVVFFASALLSFVGVIRWYSKRFSQVLYNKSLSSSPSTLISPSADLLLVFCPPSPLAASSFSHYSNTCVTLFISSELSSFFNFKIPSVRGYGSVRTPWQPTQCSGLTRLLSYLDASGSSGVENLLQRLTRSSCVLSLFTHTRMFFLSASKQFGLFESRALSLSSFFVCVSSVSTKQSCMMLLV